MTKIYVNQKEVAPKNRFDYVSFILETLVGSLTLIIASNLFKGLYIENILYAVLASIIIGFLNNSLKPLLIYLTLPITVLTMGLFYPFINVIILKITSLCLGSSFIVEGWLRPFFMGIFISVVSKLLNNMIVKKYGVKIAPAELKACVTIKDVFDVVQSKL